MSKKLKKINLGLLVNMLYATLEDCTMQKHIMLEIMECIYKVTNLNNIGVTYFTMAYNS